MSNVISNYKPAYKIFEDEISSVRLTQFLYALGETPIGVNGEKFLYFAPYRNDTEPKLLVNDHTGLWYDHVTRELGRICDLAWLTAPNNERANISSYIVKTVNRTIDILSKGPYNVDVYGVENIDMIPLSEFMKVFGQKQPISKDENFLLYNVRNGANQMMVLMINSETNHWRDLKTGLHGDIYALAAALTGIENKCQLKKCIRTRMLELSREGDKGCIQKQNPNGDKIKSKLKIRF